MSVRNLITLTSTTHSYSGTDSGAGANSIDGNWSTYQGTNGSGGGNFWSGTLISEHTFSKSRLLTQVSFRITGASYGYGSDAADSQGHTYVQYWNGSTWITFSGGEGSWAGGEGLASYDSGVVNLTPSITTTKVRVYVTSEASAQGDGSTTYGHIYLYEIEAYGEGYEDIGIRYRSGSTTYIIAGEELLSTHKLRIRKGSTTYGIPLVATNDASASPIRIYDGSAVKALAKYTA
jgi:hypothetical protein